MKKNIQNITKDSKTLLNGIRDIASPEYKATVPILVSEDEMREIEMSSSYSVQYNAGATANYTTDIRQVGQAITAFEAVKNEFVDLINRIGLAFFQKFYYENKLKKFKKGMLEFGDTIEEILVDVAATLDYAWLDGEGTIDTEENPFKRVQPDVKAFFHKLNSQKKWKTTVTEEQINLAFTNASGVFGLIDSIVESLYNGYEIYEWETTKETIADAFNAGVIKTVDIDPITTKEGLEGLVKKARAMYLKFGMPSREYNNAGVMMSTPDSRIHVLYTADLAADMDVDVLAKAFNMDRTTFLGQSTIIDKFGTGMEDVQLVIMDENFLQIYDKLMRMTSIYNPEQMYWNYVLHIWQIYSYSKLVNVVAFKTATVTEG